MTGPAAADCARRSGRQLLGLVVLAPALHLSPLEAQTRSIYGIHDFEPRPDGFTAVLESGGARGFITATEAVGHLSSDHSGKDYRPVSGRGHTVLARLNNGYGSQGTIPLRADWPGFAARCANFASGSQGCAIWVIGNETNLSGEWPAETNGYRHYISPEDYAACFRLVYDAIKAARPSHSVLPQALAPFAGPYGAAADHDGVPIDHVTYMRRMLDAIHASGGMDGVALHVPSRGYQRSDLLSTAKVNGNYWSFFCYKDWLERGVPSALWDLPVYATESNGYFYWKGGHPEDPSKTYLAGWVQGALLEIDRWNHNEAVVEGKPVIRCLNFYRWCGSCDGWNIDGAPEEAQILADLKTAVGYRLTWPDHAAPLDAPASIAIGERCPPSSIAEAPYYGVWRSYLFRMPGTAPLATTFELTGAAAAAGALDDDARLLVDSDSPTGAATWNTSAALDGSRDQGKTATARFTRTLAPGRHFLRLQIDGSPFIEKIELKLPAGRFFRGDANGDRSVDLSDALFVLFYLFTGGPAPDCPAAADADDGGSIQLDDALYLLRYLFTEGPPPPPPAACGVDPTPDDLKVCPLDRC